MPTEYPHDPDFPFLLVHRTAGVLAKFKTERFATDRSSDIAYADDYSVVDTTPKPRIPVDAQFITWSLKTHLAVREGASISWKYIGSRFTEDELLRIIGDAEITVLDPRKEES